MENERTSSIKSTNMTTPTSSLGSVSSSRPTDSFSQVDSLGSTTSKDPAKTKILLFVIGVLVGAVISTAAFLVYTKALGATTSTGDSSSQQMQGGTPPEKPGDSDSQSGQGQPPEKPGSTSDSQNNTTNQ